MKSKLTFEGVGVGEGVTYFDVDVVILVLEILVLVLGVLVGGVALQRGPMHVTVYVIWPSPWRATRSFAGACYRVD